MIAVSLGERRGAAVGVIAGLFYATLGILVLLPGQRLQRWSQTHVVADSLIFAPLLLFALLYIGPLAWYYALLGTVVVSAVVIPATVRRRRKYLRARAKT